MIYTKDSLNERKTCLSLKINIWKQSRWVLFFSLPVSTNLTKLRLVTRTSYMKSLTILLYLKHIFFNTVIFLLLDIIILEEQPIVHYIWKKHQNQINRDLSKHFNLPLFFGRRLSFTRVKSDWKPIRFSWLIYQLLVEHNTT